MKKAIWFTAIGVSSVTLLTTISLSQAASHLWKPEVAHAAKVTAHLFKTPSLNPITLARRSRVVHTPNHPGSGATTEIMPLSAHAVATSLTPSKVAQ